MSVWIITSGELRSKSANKKLQIDVATLATELCISSGRKTPRQANQWHEADRPLIRKATARAKALLGQGRAKDSENEYNMLFWRE